MKIVGLDAGHYVGDGRVATAFVKKLGTKDEYTLNARQFEYVKSALEATKNYIVVDIGHQDRNLINRTTRAKSAKCDVVISLHHNAGGGRGLTLYRNSNGVMGNASLKLEQNLYKYLEKVNRGNRSQPINSASLCLTNCQLTGCPSVLIEIAFMDNDVDVALINDVPSFQKQIANAITSGLNDYFGFKNDGVKDKTEFVKTATVRKEIVTRNSYSWLDSAIIGKAYATEKHTIIERASVEGYDMYKTAEGRYITAATAYVSVAEPNRKLSVKPHCQSIGTLGMVYDGCVAGTVGERKRLEGLTINCDYPLEYEAHCQSHGWMGVKHNGEYCGTKGEAKRLEAIKIRRTDGGHIRYRVHCQGIGWSAWAKDGAIAGTTGQKRRVEAIQIELI